MGFSFAHGKVPSGIAEGGGRDAVGMKKPGTAGAVRAGVSSWMVRWRRR
jgi:hypothetical protein